MIFINEESITWGSLLIANISILWYLFTQKIKTPAEWNLIGAFLSVGLLFFSAFLGTSLPHPSAFHFHIRRIVFNFPLISLVFLIRFVYSFPEKDSHTEKESRGISFVAGFFVLLSMSISIYALIFKSGEEIYCTLPQMSFIIIFVFVFLFSIFRRSIYFYNQSNFHFSKAIRSLIYPFLFLLMISFFEVLYILEVLPENLSNFTLSFGFLGFYLSFVIVYINHTNRTTSFMAKIIGITLTTVLFLWGNLGHIVVPFFKEIYKKENPIRSGTEILIHPIKSGEWKITSSKLSESSNPGMKIKVESEGQTIWLPFVFPLYENRYQYLKIHQDGFVSFGEIQNPYAYRNPEIHVLGSFYPVRDFRNLQIYIHSDPGRIQILWKDLYDKKSPREVLHSSTVRLTLYPDGRILFGYIQIPQYRFLYLENNSSSLDYIGILPADNYRLQEFDIQNSETIYKASNSILIQNFYLDGRKYIHEKMLPLFLILLFASFLVVFIFPVFFSSNIILPLENLIDGIRSVNSGKLDTYVEPQFHDEIGFLTQSFNLMVSSIQKASLEKEEYILETKRLNQAYHKFVPEKFLSYLKKQSILDIKLGDHREMQMTVLFSDIRSYTSLSEKMSPEENFGFLNAYLKKVSPVIRKYNGFIDKYIGDAIMALFPGEPDDALKCAIEIQEIIREYNSERTEKGRVSIQAGIGIHTGDVVIGTIGEEQRMEGTVVSDAVNISARLENLTKFYSSKILISMDTLLNLEEQLDFHYRILDKVKVKGKEEFVSVVEILDGLSPEKLENLLKTKVYFEEGLAYYAERNFSGAISSFTRVLELVPDDEASNIYIRRSTYYLKNGVPLDWDGVEILDRKFED